MTVLRSRPVGGAQRISPLIPGDLARLSGEGCERLLQSRRWARAAMNEWGLCGVGCISDGVVTGFLLVCPALHVPPGHPLAIGANADAAALLALSDDGCGRRLTQSLASRLVGRRNIEAIDAAASPAGSPYAPSYDWLDSCGFRPIDGDEGRYRLDLEATRSWLPDLGGMMRRLSGNLMPATPPEPAGRYELRAG